MLRTSLSRPLLARQFSVSAKRWNVHRSGSGSTNSKGTDDPLTTPQSGEELESTGASTSTSTSSLASGFSLDKSSSPPPSSSSSSSSLPGSSSSNTTENLQPYDLDLVKQRIREWTEQAAILLRNRADDFTSKSKTTFSQLGAQLNRVTGYEEIEALKRSVVEQEERINLARQAARSAKSAYETAVIQRSNSQREVNDLLQRKSTWTDSDVGRFTSLVRQDHLYEQEETRAKAAVDETEDAVEKEFSQLMRTILARYHEEQVWSDKIRSASTYGSLAALGLNMLVFIMAIVVVEPWKRRRLAQTFEKKLEELSEDNAKRLRKSMGDIGGQLEGQKLMLRAFREEVERQVEEAIVLRSSPPPVPEPPLVVVEATLLQKRYWEIAAVGTGAFVAGILSTILLNR